MNRTNLTYCQTTLNAPLCGTFARFTFTGKEKDVETGYNYHGARYYDAALLAGWLSVDPLADKYPGISSYAYCAWNPVKLVDPDGRKIDSASVTQDIRNLITPSHDCYNAEFAIVYKALDADQSTLYRFEQWDDFHTNENGAAISGGVSLSDDKIVTIGFTWGVETERVDNGIAPERALCEELYHAKQFSEGKIGFCLYPNQAGWRVMGVDENDENEAHAWAARVSGTTVEYNKAVYQNHVHSKSISAEEGWRNFYPKDREGRTPRYDANGLYSSNNYFFKRHK